MADKSETKKGPETTITKGAVLGGGKIPRKAPVAKPGRPPVKR